MSTFLYALGRRAYQTRGDSSPHGCSSSSSSEPGSPPSPRTSTTTSPCRVPKRRPRSTRCSRPSRGGRSLRLGHRRRGRRRFRHGCEVQGRDRRRGQAARRSPARRHGDLPVLRPRRGRHQQGRLGGDDLRPVRRHPAGSRRRRRGNLIDALEPLRDDLPGTGRRRRTLPDHRRRDLLGRRRRRGHCLPLPHPRLLRAAGMPLVTALIGVGHLRAAHRRGHGIRDDQLLVDHARAHARPGRGHRLCPIHRLPRPAAAEDTHPSRRPAVPSPPPVPPLSSPA